MGTFFERKHAMKYPGVRKPVSVGMLKNGMHVYTYYDASGTGSLCGVGVRVGSIHDPSSARGIAHLTEHMLARESRTHSGDEVYRLLYRYAGGLDNLKIETERTSTFYGFQDLYRQAYIAPTFDLIAALLKDRLLSAQGLKVEQAAIHNEHFLTGVDLPENYLDDLYFEAQFEFNPARYPIIGYPETFQAITIPQIRSFVRKHYVPHNMFALVFGPRHKDAMEMARARFEDIPAHAYTPVDYRNFSDVMVVRDVRSLERERVGIGQYHLMVGYPTCTYFSSEGEALDVVSQILERRILTTLRDANTVFDRGTYRVRVFTDRTAWYGILAVRTATVSGEYAEYSRQVITNEVRRLCSESVSADECDEMVAMLKEETLGAFRSSPSVLADMVIHATCNGDFDLQYMHNQVQRLSRVTPRRIREIAQKYFSKGYCYAMIKPA